MIPSRTTVRGRCAALATSVFLLAVVVFGVAPHVAGAAVARGIADPTLTLPGARLDAAVQAEALEQMGSSKLRASYVRFVVSWAAAEPAGTGDPAGELYLAGVDQAVALAKANGLKVIVTFAYVPEWASNQTLWKEKYGKVVGYQRNYAMKTDATTLDAFQEFCRRMASRLQVWGYECWNEPNLHLTLYPQSTAEDKDFGAHVYLKMLKEFSIGIRGADPGAVLMAGATAPRGYTASAPLDSRRMMTSPQRFAGQIKAHGASSLFDAYSHHPYTPGASANNWPEAPPRDADTTVNLQNLGALLKVFPSKPFYLTEYGYQTDACQAFSGQYVSLAKQADYLRRAYAYAGRYSQVKVLMWFLLDDFLPLGTPPYEGFYTGLRKTNLEKKPAWYAFARGNTLTLSAPSSAAAGAAVKLRGTLTSATEGRLGGKTLVVQSRRAGKSWTKLATARTGSDDGSYTVTIRPTRSASYRVVWTGVITSRVRSIKL